MRNESGESRGFGFVSFQSPSQGTLPLSPSFPPPPLLASPLPPVLPNPPLTHSPANSAMHAMNGAQLGTKQIVVRLHEPKQLRQEKLAQRFGHHHHHNGHPRSASGATSPAASDAGDSYIGFSSPRRLSATLPLPLPIPLSPDRDRDRGAERSRRGSGSYYNASPPSLGLMSTLNLPMRYDDLAGLSPVVRREVLSGDLARRVKNLPAHLLLRDGDGDGEEEEVARVVDALVGLALSEVVQCIEDPGKLEMQVRAIRGAGRGGVSGVSSGVSGVSGVSGGVNPNTDTNVKSSSPSAQSHDSTSSLDPGGAGAGATASAPEHPSTPVSLSPPRTSSPGPTGTAASPASERARMRAAVAKLERGLELGESGMGKGREMEREELVDLLMGLPRRERAMCLFNAEVLRGKLGEARGVLDAEAAEAAEAEADAAVEGGAGEGGEGGGEGDTDTRSTRSAPSQSRSAPPVTPVTKRAQAQGQAQASYAASPKTPELSSRGPSAASSPLPGTPGATAPATAPATSTTTGTSITGTGTSTTTTTTGGATAGGWTLATLAKLPASEIVRIASTGALADLGVPIPDGLVVRATDEFVDGLRGLQVSMQKQLLGDKLFKVVKSFGVRGAPKVTIALLDQEDLRALAHLMNSYPAVLKEKALLAGAVALPGK
ncbi:hypothetical protein C0992_011208 [Termitomyces sp. T32_za158]|nr:hypothetical protein C0992_011208 [Termitomyces sp. T32_za158]